MHSQRNRFAGYHFKHVVYYSLLQFAAASGRAQGVPKLSERIDRSLEAEPIRILAVQMSGLLQQRSNQIVGDDEHQQFLADHFASCSEDAPCPSLF